MNIDKSAWGEGPWQNEPDRLEFEAEGFPCLANRNRMGVWCGYVALPPGHPWHGKKLSDRMPVDSRENLPVKTGPVQLFIEATRDGDDGCVSFDVLVRVHGGLTYAAKCRDEICHVPKPGEPDDVWWIGFDCGHAGDMIPSSNVFRRQYGLPDLGEEYRTVDYVKAECVDLAKQAREAAAK